MSHQFLEILPHCQTTDFVNFLTWDQPWLFLDYPHFGIWAASRDEAPKTPMTKHDTENCMISIIWSISGIHSLLRLTKGMKYNSQYFCQHVIPHIQQNICSSSRRKSLKDILLHLDKATAHNLRPSSEKIESAKAQRVPHAPYSPDQTQHQVASSSLVI
jgi:hypothetical protein